MKKRKITIISLLVLNSLSFTAFAGESNTIIKSAGVSSEVTRVVRASKVDTKKPTVNQPVVVERVEDFPMSEIIKIENDKEVVLSSISKNEKERILTKFNSSNDKNKYRTIFFQVMHKFLNTNDATCDSSMISSLVNEVSRSGVAKNEFEMNEVFKFLRVSNVIDDVMLDILEGLSKDYFALSRIDFNAYPNENPFKNYDKKSEGYELALFFQEFKTIPDEKTKCAYREFSRLQGAVGEKKDNLKTRNKILKDLALKAYKEGAVDLKSYNLLKFLSTTSTLNKRSVWLGDYINISLTAKNKMAPKNYKYKVVNIEDENKYTSERKSRFSKMTLRKVLYQKYDANQIILLSQVMKKASQRMGVDPDTITGVPYIIQEFEYLSEDGNENYVEKIELDTQSQFNLARRLLRRDIVKLQMMDSFLSQKITYDDLVTASVETGYISLDDLDYVVKYDDLWNPEISHNQKMMNMGFMIAGYATFFLPPPWNVTGALALTIAEGVIESKNAKGVNNDNPNTFIE